MADRVIVAKADFDALINLAKYRGGADWADWAEKAEAAAVPFQARQGGGPGARSTDPETSKAHAGKSDLTGVGVDSDAHRSLVTFSSGPLTDYEAASASVPTPPTRTKHETLRRRCSDLRSMGLIEPTGEVRVSDERGGEREVCRLTPLGRSALQTLTEGKRWRRW